LKDQNRISAKKWPITRNTGRPENNLANFFLMSRLVEAPNIFAKTPIPFQLLNKHFCRDGFQENFDSPAAPDNVEEVGWKC
jgi:hypothetical protein